MIVLNVSRMDRPKHGTRAFTDAEEDEIRTAVDAGANPYAVAVQLEVHPNTILNAVRRSRKRNAPADQSTGLSTTAKAVDADSTTPRATRRRKAS